MKQVIKNKRVIALIAAVVLTVALLASGVIASPPTLGDPPVASKINYQGQLTDNEGNPMNGTYDMVIGERTEIFSKMPLHRQLSNRTVNLVVSLLSGVRTTDVQCGFRFVDLKIFNNVRLKTNNYQTESEMVIRAARNKHKIGFVPITTIYGNEKSHIRGLIDTMRFINMAVRFLWR